MQTVVRQSPRRTCSAALTIALVGTTTGCASAPATAAPATAASTATARANLGIVDTRIGAGVRAAARQCLYVHYVGALADGRAFESSRTPLSSGQVPPPIAFELGAGSVMAGWEKGLVAMQVGGTRRLFVPYAMAYGTNGRPPSIPPRTDLVFDIELLAVAPPLPTSSNAPRAETARTCPAWTPERFYHEGSHSRLVAERTDDTLPNHLFIVLISTTWWLDHAK